MPTRQRLLGSTVAPRRHVENVSSLILGGPRGATFNAPCWNQPSLYREPRTNYYTMGLFTQILPDEFLMYFMRSEETYGINPIA